MVDCSIVSKLYTSCNDVLDVAEVHLGHATKSDMDATCSK